MIEPQVIKALQNDCLLNMVTKNFISLQEEHRKTNNEHLTTFFKKLITLKQVITTIIEMMKKEDKFFETVYKRPMYGGSYYKGTKVGAPEEFDLDIIIKLPIEYSCFRFIQDKPGFVKIHSGLTSDGLASITEANRMPRKFFDCNMYLDQECFRRWIEGIMSKVISNLPYNGAFLLKTHKCEYKIKIRKGGPAFTIEVTLPEREVISVDLVPVLAFTEPLPKQKAKLQSFKAKEWFAVPKPLHNSLPNGNLYWRLCFYEQEKEFLGKHGRMKSVIKHVKKLRDTQNWKSIASYYIETLCLNEIEKIEDLTTAPLSLLIFKILIKLHNAFTQHKIPYYWDNSYNLLEKIENIEMFNITTRLGNIINDIKKNIVDDKFAMIKYILHQEEVEKLKRLQSDPLKNTHNRTVVTDKTDTLRTQKVQEVKLLNQPKPTLTSTGTQTTETTSEIEKALQLLEMRTAQIQKLLYKLMLKLENMDEKIETLTLNVREETMLNQPNTACYNM